MRSPKTMTHLRLPTYGQDVKRNRADILDLAIEKNLGKIYWVGKAISGEVSWKKRKIADMVDRIVSELSHLCRSMLGGLKTCSTAK